MDCLSIQMPPANPDTTAGDHQDMADAARDETKLQRALVGGGAAMSSAALFIALFRAPGGVFLRDKLLVDAYYAILAVVFVFGAVEVAAGYWVAGDPRRRHGKGKVVMWASVVPLVLVTALGGFAVLR
ncbi:hypothetical protein ACQ4PT_008167 [Festuca glaucescens]